MKLFRKISVLSLLSLVALPCAVMAQTSDAVRSPEEEAARQAWRDTMHRVEVPGEGCFHASYPSTEWQQVDCLPPNGYRSAVPLHRNEYTLGNGSDYVAAAPSGDHFSLVAGTWPTVTGVTSEKTVNVPFGSGESDGITGKNQYTVQVNTNFANTAACKTYTKCLAWQQYVISSDAPVSLTSSKLTGDTEVFIEYWLIDYGSKSTQACPSGFLSAGADSEGPGVDCVQNTSTVKIYTGQLPATDLAGLALSGSATSGGTDKATATYGGDAYAASVADSYTDIASGWDQAEFNFLGNAGGAQAQFNTGVSLTAKMALTYGSTATPTCEQPSAEDGTTGETNNLNAKSCTATGGSSPNITFVESD
jgi:hypothetical protein